MSTDVPHAGESKHDTLQITEDEAAVYDRQIRLWGLEAQQRMRNATILVVRVRGTATEAIKNIVLAGIGKLVLVDSDDVAEEDLGAGFFFRDEDVGNNKAEAAKARIEGLNPLVSVQVMKHPSILEGIALDALVSSVDLVCVTDWNRKGLIHMNEVCRRFGKPFYAGGTFGLLGYIFCDLLQHECVVPDRSGQSGTQRIIKTSQLYPPLHMALRHRWSNLTKRQAKDLNPAALFTILGIWEYQATHDGVLPDSMDAAPELATFAKSAFDEAAVTPQALASVPSEMTESAATTAAHEFSPVCAVVGGMLGQDILKSLAAREAPIANFFVFDGHISKGTVVGMNMS